MEENNFTPVAISDLFNLWREQAEKPIIELLDINKRPVGALYLKHFVNKGPIAITTTNNQERYYFYCDGIGLYFSFFKKFFLDN